MAKGRKTGGRKPGSVNKVTATVKQAFTEAFAEMGGTAALVRWAKDYPTEFFKLLSKLLPIEVAASVAGTLRLQVVEEIVDGDGSNAHQTNQTAPGSG